jgi:hypothetical protein
MTGPTARLVGVVRPDLDGGAVERSGRAVDQPLGQRGRTAAALADRLKLVDELGDAEQRRHRPEGQSPEVLRQSGGDDAGSPADELLDHAHDAVVEELHLVDADGVVALGEGGTSALPSAVAARTLTPAWETT